jgi:hypothetical protein
MRERVVLRSWKGIERPKGNNQLIIHEAYNLWQINQIKISVTGHN